MRELVRNREEAATTKKAMTAMSYPKARPEAADEDATEAV